MNKQTQTLEKSVAPTDNDESRAKFKLPVYAGAGPYEFCHNGGLQDLVDVLTNSSTPLYTDVHTITAKASKNGIEVDVALRWMKDSYSEDVIGTFLLPSARRRLTPLN